MEQMIKSNSFKEIIIDDMEHIIYNTPVNHGYGEGYLTDPESRVKVFDKIHQLLEYNFTKKYNLVYQNEKLDCQSEAHEHIRPWTEIMCQVALSNPDKIFMIVDHNTLDHYMLDNVTNCQVWPRKYFSQPYGYIDRDHENIKLIQRQRQHWFCSVLGRSAYFRTQMFNKIIDRGWHKDNKVSYQCYLNYGGPPESDADKQKNFMDTSGDTAYRDLIPFNNFENISEQQKKELHLPQDGINIRKLMPVHDCLFNLTVETSPDGGNAFYTEKTLNTVVHGHVPVVLAGPGVMGKLQQMGLIIPDYIPWSIWDDLEFGQRHFDRIDIVIRQLDRLFTRHSLQDIANDWYPYALKNFNKLLELPTNCALEEQEICRWILTATHNLSNRKYQYLWNF